MPCDVTGPSIGKAIRLVAKSAAIRMAYHWMAADRTADQRMAYHWMAADRTADRRMGGQPDG